MRIVCKLSIDLKVNNLIQVAKHTAIGLKSVIEYPLSKKA
ncbi:hypothetical protein IFVP177_C1100020 [Vibrio parahaemolyticus]